jgi:hypothetical protein
VDEAGIDPQKLDFLFDLKNYRRGRMSEYAEKYRVPYFPDKSVWDVVREQNLKVDLAFPSAHENEINQANAEALVKNGCYCVSEGANMPSDLDAIQVFLDNNVLYAPGKAANAGGVAVSGLEMAQNAMRMSWSREEVDQKLQVIMHNIHQAPLGSIGSLRLQRQLCGWRQYRRLYESCQRHAGLWDCLMELFHTTNARISPGQQRFFIHSFSLVFNDLAFPADGLPIEGRGFCLMHRRRRQQNQACADQKHRRDALAGQHRRGGNRDERHDHHTIRSRRSTPALEHKQEQAKQQT